MLCPSYGNLPSSAKTSALLRLYGSSTTLSSVIGVYITKALDSAGALLVRAILAFGSGSGSSASAFSTALLRF
jgi:hypothetical protein